MDRCKKNRAVPQSNGKNYAFHLLKEIADWLSAGMADLKSDWFFVWDEARKDFKAINKSNGSSLEIHLRNISGFVSNRPEFNMCIFPRKRRGTIGCLNLDTVKFMPCHHPTRWESHKASDGTLDTLISHGEIGTPNNKPLKASGFRRMGRMRLPPDKRAKIELKDFP